MSRPTRSSHGRYSPSRASGKERERRVQAMLRGLQQEIAREKELREFGLGRTSSKQPHSPVHVPRPHP